MSDPMSRDVDLTLDRWMDAVAPERAPASLLEETFARTMTASQRRPVPWRRIRIGARPVTAARSLAWIALLVILTIAIVAVALLSSVGGPPRPVEVPSESASHSPSPSPSPTASPSGPPPVSVTPEATIAVQNPLFMATDGTVPWLINEAGEIVRIDPARNAIGATGQVGPSGDPYQGLAASADGAWVTDWDTQHVFRVDPATLTVTDTMTVGVALKGVIATDAAVWVADTRGGEALRIDPATNQVAARVPVGNSGPAGPNWLGAGLDSIWVDVPNNGSVARIDPITNAVQATIKPPVEFVPCGGFAIGTDAVWVTGCSEQKQLIRIDPATNTVAEIIKVDGYGNYPTMINGSAWVSLDRGGARNGQIVRIGRLTDSVDRVLVPGTAFGGGGNLVVAGGSVWVSDAYNDAVIRLPLSAFAS